MAKFNDLIKSGKIESAYLKKQAALAELSYNEKIIKDLDSETPTSAYLLGLKAWQITHLMH